MERIDVIDFTGGLFASTWFYILPAQPWLVQGEKYAVYVDRSLIGTASISAITTLPMGKITPGMAKVATGKDLRQFKAWYAHHYKVGENDHVSVLVMEWVDMDVAILRALMSLRFDQVKGIHPHERKAQLSLSI